MKKVNAIDTNGLVKKTGYDADIRDSERKIPSITGLATTFTFTIVQNKIQNVSDVVRKATDFDANISDT